MPAIGIQTTREMLDVLFDAFDEDGSGEIEFAELQARLVHAAMHCTLYTLHTLLLHCYYTVLLPAGDAAQAAPAALVYFYVVHGIRHRHTRAQLA